MSKHEKSRYHAAVIEELLIIVGVLRTGGGGFVSVLRTLHGHDEFAHAKPLSED